MKRILLTGGPGTGKTTVLSELRKRSYICFPEVSREIILEAKKKGIDQLFLSKPDEFNEQLLTGRISQFNNCASIESEYIFLDRGLPDIIAYNNYIKIESSPEVITAVTEFIYDFVFVFPPWKNIYKNDNERYESFDETQRIHENLKNTYKNLSYDVCEVPIGDVGDRANYILNIIEYS